MQDDAREEGEIDSLRLYLRVLGNPKLLIVFPHYVLAEGRSASESAGDLQLEYRDQETELSVSRSSSARSEPGAMGPQSEPEETGAPPGTLGGTEAAIAQAFSKFGYQVRTSDDLASVGLVPPEILAQARQGITEDVVKVARATSADLVLLGLLRMAPARKISPAGVKGFVSVTGETSAKAIIVSSGRVVDTFHSRTTRAHTSPLAAQSAVFDLAAKELAAAFAWKIPSLLVEHPRESRLVLDGVSTEEAMKIKASLVELPDVETVSINRLPSASNNWGAELIVSSGFVRIEQERLLAVCQKAISNPKAPSNSLLLLDSDKFQMRLGRDVMFP